MTKRQPHEIPTNPVGQVFDLTWFSVHHHPRQVEDLTYKTMTSVA
ncbi:MAG: hypothetical protein AAGA25_14235 [Planctomycetota bacterium]